MTDYRKVFIDTAPFIYYLEQNPQYECDLFLTNDKQLRQEKKIRCVTLDDL